MFTAANEQFQFTAIASDGTWPQAKKHTQWPGDGPNKGKKGDPIFDAFYATQVETVISAEETQRRNQDAGAALLDKIGPAIVLTHSMSGAYGWKLLERHGERITKLIAVAPAPPGNIQRPAEIVGETVDAVTIRLEGTTMAIARHSEQPIERAFVDHTLIGGSTLFPRDQIASYAAALNPIPARLLLERRNVAGSQLRVVDFSKFRGKPVLVLTGTNDLGHARAVDEPIVDWLNANGAEADFIYLGDLGITGNGHMLMLERNSDALAQLIIDWIES